MRFVQLLRVLEVHLEYIALSAVGWMVGNGFSEPSLIVHPPEASCGEGLAHRPAIEVIGVQVQDVTLGLRRVVALNHRVVSLGISFRNHRNPAPHPLLDEEVLVIVCE